MSNIELSKDDCRKPKIIDPRIAVPKECCIKKIVSDTLDVTGGCPECDKVRIELKPVPKCIPVECMMNNDVLEFDRNGVKHCITWEKLLICLGAKKCLD